jgi:hypothetical protein
MKYFLEFEDYADCFVEVEEKWTMKELKEVVASDEETYFNIFKRKVTSILIRDVNGNELRDITQFNEEFLDNVDVAVAGFLGMVLIKHIRDRRSLGGLSVRPSSTGSESKTTKN